VEILREYYTIKYGNCPKVTRSDVIAGIIEDS
jgi:hypothetical protein